MKEVSKAQLTKEVSKAQLTTQQYEGLHGKPLKSGSEVLKLLSYSTQLSKKFQLLIKTKLKYRQIKKFLDLSILDVVFIMLINVKVPITVGILTFMSRINFVLS